MSGQGPAGPTAAPRLKLWALLGAGLLAAGCGSFGVADIAAVPDSPTYSRDIQHIVHDHCALCHSKPSNRGAYTYFRLDRFEDDAQVLGAGSMASDMARQVGKLDRMPPSAQWGNPLPPKAKATLLKWVANGAPP